MLEIETYTILASWIKYKRHKFLYPTHSYLLQSSIR